MGSERSASGKVKAAGGTDKEPFKRQLHTIVRAS